MKLTRLELENLLKSLGVQVFYDHTTKKDMVNLPFIIYFDTRSNNFSADNKTYGEIMNYTIIVHSAMRDETLEGQLKELLNTNHIPYENTDITWLNDLLMWAVQFEITL